MTEQGDSIQHSDSRAYTFNSPEKYSLFFFPSRLLFCCKTLHWNGAFFLCRSSLVLFPFQFDLQAACYNEIMTVGSIVNIKTTGFELPFLPPVRLSASVLNLPPFISDVEEFSLFVRSVHQSIHQIPSLSAFAFCYSSSSLVIQSLSTGSFMKHTQILLIFKCFLLIMSHI